MRIFALLLTLTIAACSSPTNAAPGSQPAPAGKQTQGQPAFPATPPPGLAYATFAGGCFWCMEKPFEVLPGVKEVVSGYTDGHVKHPTYKLVTRTNTGHTEAVRIVYDPKQVTFERLLEVFWHNIDPTQANGQFCDRGSSYRSGIYTHGATQQAAAIKSRDTLAKSAGLPGPIVTEIEPASTFYVAEDYHQDSYKTNPSHYRRYRAGCGRDARLKALWGDKAGR